MQTDQTRSLSARIVRLREVIALTGLCRSTIYEKTKPGSRSFDPRFPKPISLGQRSVGWRENEIQTWISSRPLSTNREAA